MTNIRYRLKRAAVTGLVAAGVFLCGTSLAPGQPSANGSATSNAVLKNGITIVANLPPGGITDTAARALQPYLQRTLGVPVRVRNIAGGGGNTAAQYVYHLSASQPVLMMGYLPQLAIGELIGEGDYKLLRYTPIYGVFGDDTSIYIAKSGAAIRRFSDLVDSKRPIIVGVFGIKSSAGWLSTELLRIVNHVRIQAVPFANGTAAADAVLGGSIDVAAVPRSIAEPLVKQGRAQAVLEFGPRRLPFLPGAESIASVGKASEAFTTQLGLLGPPEMPADVVALLQQAVARTMNGADFKEEADKVNLSVYARTAPQWAGDLKRSYSQIDAQRTSLAGPGASER